MRLQPFRMLMALSGMLITAGINLVIEHQRLGIRGHRVVDHEFTRAARAAGAGQRRHRMRRVIQGAKHLTVGTVWRRAERGIGGRFRLGICRQLTLRVIELRLVFQNSRMDEAGSIRGGHTELDGLTAGEGDGDDLRRRRELTVGDRCRHGRAGCARDRPRKERDNGYGDGRQPKPATPRLRPTARRRARIQGAGFF